MDEGQSNSGGDFPDRPEGSGPLHGPDPYGTPPYGRPGPWAPAPPVQRPLPTPPGGTPLPPGATAAPPPPGRAQEPAPPGPVPPGVPLRRYDPWAPVSTGSVFPGGGPAPGGPGGGDTPRLDAVPPGKPGRARLLTGALIVALAAGTVGGAVGVQLERNGAFSEVRLEQTAVEDRDAAPGTVAGIAEAVLPGVVTLHVRGGGSGGTGTGFVLDDQGHILTNAHVVRPAGSGGRIQVTFSSGDTVRAEIIGQDSGYDLAVVKVTGVSGLSPLPLGDSDMVRVGDPVVAFGAPFDLDGTVTAGIISATDRPITAGGARDGGDVSYVNALQTDAPINPGNSGGPLVDADGRVVGINSAIRTPELDQGPENPDDARAGSVGLGFAIPVNQGKRVAEQLINTGRATHPVIGVKLDMGYAGEGARVAGGTGGPAVVPGGPAAAAGVREGDVITAVNGDRVRSGEELIVRVRGYHPGDELRLTLERDGREEFLSVTLGEASDD